MLPLEVATYLSTAGLGLTPGINLFDRPFPEAAQDQAVYVEALPGRPNDRTFGPSGQAPLGEWPSFLVMVRDSRENDGAAELLAQRIYRALDNLGPVTFSGVLYRDIRATLGAPTLTYDHSDRPLWVCHFEADKNVSP